MVLVMGGTGFIGTWLAEMLACLNDDFEFNARLVLAARGVDRFASQHPHLASRPDIRLQRVDIRYLSEIPRETNWVVHAASTPDTRFHASRPIETMTTIFEGTANVIRALDPVTDVRRLLYLSSGYVYGAQPWDLPLIPESYQGGPSLIASHNAYPEAKRAAETLCAAARSEKHLPVVIARPFAFLGPYQSLETPWAANNFLLDALSGRPIRILGDGETVRSYMYASDMVYWLLRILTASESNQAWNVGSPQPVTLRALAGKIATSVMPEVEIHLHAAAHTNVPRTRFVPDVSVAQKHLGLDLRVSLEDAVERTIRWNMSARVLSATAR
jgi:dTDP-glucose 4,6-dehydratase